MRPWIWITIASVLAVALVATGATAVVQARNAADAEQHADDLDAEVQELRDEVADLREELAAAERALDGASDGSGEGDDGDEGDGGFDLGGGLDLDGMLGDLLGGSIPGEECITPDADGLDGLLGGLLGDSEPRPDDPDELVDVIADQVAEMRELEWQEPVAAEFLTSAELHERLESILDEDLDPDELDAAERLLTTLGAIPEDADLEQLQRDLLDDQVAGFYSPETGELVVRVPDDGELRPVDLVTLSHELEHALADQALGLPDRAEPPFDGDDDATLAVLAVIEGDASLLMNRWALGELSFGDQLAMAMDPNLLAAQSALDDVPHYLQRELLFPYTEGLDWVCQVYLEGGWSAVDAAYDDPPTTTAEVLWGASIGAATPPESSAPDGFDEVLDTTLGAAPLQWLFEAPGGATDRALDDPEGRARAWGGGTATVWARGDDTAVALSLIDGGTGSATLCDSVGAWYEAAYPGADVQPSGAVTTHDVGAASLRCDGDEVLLGIGPDAETVESITSG